MVQVSLSSAEQVVLRVAPVDVNGASREVSDISWANSGAGVLTVADDKLSATYVPAEGAEDATDVVTVSGDADLTDAGVVTLSDTFEIAIAGVVPQATILGLTADAPTPKA